MKVRFRIILIWAIVSTIACVACILGPFVKNQIYIMKLNRIENMSIVEQEDLLMQRIVKTTEPMTSLDRKRQLNEIWARIVDVDPTDIGILISYGTSCMNLAYNEKDSSEVQFLKERIIWVAERLRKIDSYSGNTLLFAAKLYTYMGLYEKSYYDTSNVIYDRINFLISVDSVEIPEIAQHDENVWTGELKEVVRDSRLYNKIIQRGRQRKYPFIN
ncbi:hypothetical protein A2Y85_03715 [candidate division WOR-3 bacterium RBG_13_43_14]|uniref:Uncharacterized protein n=1 Tax=candidate division WOR-3 bacterium RBG_13_43_14 TaxID=1802590 RepID=A0A1F4U9F3_UNCW3|nr:MAG: hypothetical protein A2Y85_03715 [candidate division WOR-3 bacterium RBG_13_43_14]